MSLRARAKILSSGEDVLCLHALAQPLVSEMQEVIRFQNKQLAQSADAIRHALIRIGSSEELQHHLGICTETFERLTAAFAEIEDLPVDQVREDVIPGSSAFHRKTEEAA